MKKIKARIKSEIDWANSVEHNKTFAQKITRRIRIKNKIKKFYEDIHRHKN